MLAHGGQRTAMLQLHCKVQPSHKSSHKPTPPRLIRKTILCAALLGSLTGAGNPLTVTITKAAGPTEIVFPSADFGSVAGVTIAAAGTGQVRRPALLMGADALHLMLSGLTFSHCCAAALTSYT